MCFLGRFYDVNDEHYNRVLHANKYAHWKSFWHFQDGIFYIKCYNNIRKGVIKPLGHLDKTLASSRMSYFSSLACFTLGAP